MAFFYTVNPLMFYQAGDASGAPSGALPISDADHAALFSGQTKGQLIVVNSDNTLSSGPAPVPAPTYTAVQTQAVAALAAGLTITCTSTPALNGVYAADPATLSHLQTEMLSLLANGTFADGGTTLTWPLLNGTSVTVPSVAEAKHLGGALLKFAGGIAKVKAGVSTTLPASSVTIA